MKLGFVESLKEHKEVILMIFGTVTEVGAVVLAVRNGIKAKEKLDELPEDATTKDKVFEIAPDIAPVLGLTVLSLGSFWWVRKFDIDKIVSMGSVAAMAAQQKKNQDEAVREIVDEKVYSDIQEKTAEKNMESGGFHSDRPVFDAGLPGSTVWVGKRTGAPIKATKEWLESRFLQWQNDILKKAATGKLKARDVTCDTLYSDYWFVPKKSWMSCFGWDLNDIPNLKLKFGYPDEKPDDSVFGVPFAVFYVNIEDKELIPFR